MASMVFAASFLDALAELDEAVEAAVWAKLELVAVMPGCGSALASDLLRKAYGPDCLKIAVKNYLVLYDYDRSLEAVCVLGIVPQRRVR